MSTSIDTEWYDKSSQYTIIYPHCKFVSGMCIQVHFKDKNGHKNGINTGSGDDASKWKDFFEYVSLGFFCEITSINLYSVLYI